MSNICDVGVDPRMWYPACRERELKPRELREVTFLERTYVVYRDERGDVHCLDNACAHRRVALHEGEVRGCRLVCPYHGWEYDHGGALAHVPYWPEGKKFPELRVKDFPVAVRGGLVWFVPEPSPQTPPEPPQATVARARQDWCSFDLDRVFDNHYAVGLVNGMDYYHFHLHRRYQPWSQIELVTLDTDDDSVYGEYLVHTGRSRPERVLRGLLGSRSGQDVVTNRLTVYYPYPHHRAELGDGITVWVFFRPERRDRVAVYITMYVRASGWRRRVRQVFEPVFKRLVLGRIQAQDAWVGELEQRAWEQRPDEPRCEVNPVASAAERLLRARWQRYRAEVSA